MKRKKEDFKIKKRRIVFSKGPIHLVDCDVELENGHIVSRQILEHPGAVVIVPRTNKGRYLLIRQFRFATSQWIWEFPAGGIEKGENEKKAAARELAEETGYFPRKLTKMLRFYPTPGISAEVMHLYLAENLIARKMQGDADEDIEVFEVSLSQLGRMIQSKQIIDGKTILAYFCLKQRVRSA